MLGALPLRGAASPATTQGAPHGRLIRSTHPHQPRPRHRAPRPGAQEHRDQGCVQDHGADGLRLDRRRRADRRRGDRRIQRRRTRRQAGLALRDHPDRRLHGQPGPRQVRQPRPLYRRPALTHSLPRRVRAAARTRRLDGLADNRQPVGGGPPEGWRSAGLPGGGVEVESWRMKTDPHASIAGRRGALALARLLVPAAVLLFAAAPASAATTIGQTSAASVPCTQGNLLVQGSTSAGDDYAVPSGGEVITSWSTYAGRYLGSMKLQIVRPRGADQYSVVAESPP